jgi:hypothetical protein
MPRATVAASVPRQEDPDAICPTCRALPHEERRLLRDQAMARMMRQETERQK